MIPRSILSILAGCLLAGIGVQGQPAQTYPVDAASVAHPNVPKGELVHHVLDSSVIFPGTRRDYWIYIPAQYNPDKPACVYVNQDGVQWNAPTVFET